MDHKTKNPWTTLADLTRLLPRQDRPHLTKHRDALLQLAREAKTPRTSQAALAALVAADQSTKKAWQLTVESKILLLDLLRAVDQFPAEISREPMFQQVRPLLESSPSSEIQSAAIEAAALLDEQGNRTFELLSVFVQQGTHPDACIRAISNISSDQWTPNRRKPLANSLLRHLEKMPLNQRTSSNAQNTRQLLQTISKLLSSTEATNIESELERLAVKTIQIKAIEEQMRYDQPVLVLQAAVKTGHLAADESGRVGMIAATTDLLHAAFLHHYLEGAGVRTIHRAGGAKRSSRHLFEGGRRCSLRYQVPDGEQGNS